MPPPLAGLAVPPPMLVLLAALLAMLPVPPPMMVLPCALSAGLTGPPPLTILPGALLVGLAVPPPVTLAVVPPLPRPTATPLGLLAGPLPPGCAGRPRRSTGHAASSDPGRAIGRGAAGRNGSAAGGAGSCAS